MLVVVSTKELGILLGRGRLTGVGERSLLGVEVALSLLGDDHGVLTLVFGSHCVWVVCVWVGFGIGEEEGCL
jgi:hypothetical protein